MAPWSATCIVSIGVAGLFWLDHERNSRVSGSLWLATVWLFLSCSRSVAEWMGNQGPGDPMEGSPIDRDVCLILIIIGVAILVGRGRRVTQIALTNAPLVLCFLYCAISILWSDYPDIAFKRWIKAFGDIVVVLIVMSERDRVSAIKKLLTWTGFLLIPLSILLIKYYPDLGRGYSRYEGTVSYNGVATSKNGLGAICLIFGLSALWRLLSEFRPRRHVGQIRPMIAQGSVFLMAVWLFWIVNSMTSLWCFFMGASLLVATHFRFVAKRMRIVHGLVAAVILIPFSMLFLNFGSNLAHGATGRDVSTLTDRTNVWAACLKVAGNPIFGTGFESFWLGHRLEAMWAAFWWHPNEAHNGYLEVYLNLGWMGIIILAIVVVTGYRTVIAGVRRNATGGNLMLALFAVAVVYNFTEAAFLKMMTPVWIMFLLATTRTPFSESDRQDVGTGVHQRSHPFSRTASAMAAK